MMWRSFIALSAITLGGVCKAQAAVGVVPPAMYAPQMWQGRSEAVLHVLNRLDAHLETMSVPVGGTATYRTLSIAVDACVSRPLSLAEDAGALVHLRDSGDTTRPPFDGWMMENEPGIAVYGSPLYDVRVVSCGGAFVAPNPGPLPVPPKPVLPGEDAPNTTGDGGNGAPVPLAPDAQAAIPLAPPDNAATSLVPSAPPAPLQQKSAPSDLAPPESVEPNVQ
ncbi:DUF2155 domain-containing protein [Neokomagataea thailandica]|uniref:DUF2155 domain-containing protein n=1 Tax=Neokomagataea tanensis NBRC 106556 TaxID=1223519 RepID=A0ABQ0QIM5_9PROT|nr:MULTISPECIES: DUF2155 domain-containing protein [Neokomagataea]GBR46164.1 hypothetical protein AA106556_1018 [Neokomagataea tanensis NBRC 106556]